MKYLLLLLLALPVTSQTIEYNKFDNRTLVKSDTRTVDLDTVRGGVVRMALAGSHPGSNKEPLIAFYLWVVSNSRSWRFLEYNQLTFLIDGERRKIGQAEHRGKILSGTVSETLGYRMTAEDVRAITSAASVEFQIGSHTGKLSEKDKAAFRPLLDYK